MASEILSIPEEDLPYVIRIITYGIRNSNKIDVTIPERVITNLITWCEDELIYLENLVEND